MKRTKHIRLALFLLQIFCTFYLFSQDPSTYNYSVEHGLPSNEVYHVMQDSKGYMWFCTDKGVSKYDGYSFENFTTDDGLTDNTVFFSYEDEKGRIWFLSYSPLLSYYDGKEICQFRFNDSIYKKDQNLIPKVSFQVTGDKIYVGTNEFGGYSIDAEGHVERLADHAGVNVFVSDTLNLIYKETKLIGERLGKNQLVVNGKNYQYERRKELISRIFTHNKTTYFSEGTNLFSYQNGHMTHLLKTNNLITSIFISKKNDLYISSIEQGVEIFTIEGSNIKKKHSFFTDKSISWVAEDREGGMWFTTLKRGVLYHSARAGSDRAYYHELPDLEVLDICHDEKESVFVSYVDGSVWKVSDNHTEEVWPSENKNLIASYNPILWDFNSQNLITIYDVEKWLLKANDKIIKYYEQIRETKYSTSKLLKIVVKKMHIDSTGAVWVGSNEGVYKFKNGEIVQIINDNNIPIKEKKGNKRRYKIDAINSYNGKIIVSALDGLNEANGDKFYSLGHIHQLLKSRIEVISYVINGPLLLGTRGNGLIVYSKDTVYNISHKLGLRSNLVNTIAVDEHGIIWVGTNRGLNKLNLNSDQIEILDVSTSSEFVKKSMNKIVSIKDQLWIGTAKGLRVINKSQFNPDSILPELNIEKVMIHDSILSLNGNHFLDFEQNTIGFYFTGISFSNAGNVNYEYKLNGIENEWRSTKSREVRYNSLPPGDYTFSVRASNETNVWSEVESFSFKISPPFYLSWYFISFMSLTLMSLFLYVFYRREKSITEKAEFKQRSSQLELQALRAQMNPHFTFNTLSSIQQYILQNDSVKANDYLSQFANLIRRVLENSRNQRIKLSDEIESLENYLSLEQLRFPKKITYNIDKQDDIDLENITVPPALIQPFVENAIIHGIAHKDGPGHIEITLIEDENGLICTISDNGIGRKRSIEINAKSNKQKTSLGMQITKDRLDLLKDANNSNYGFNIIDLIDNEGNVKGTTVEIFISNKY